MLTQDIHKSWQRFKVGLAIFVAGVVLLFSLSHVHLAFYYLSVGILLIGFGYAMLGYAGIFLQRFAFIKDKKPPPKF